jgi:hypothetical protein
MITVLNDYIDKYIQNADSLDDKTIARHLKEIIPKTTHMDKNTFNEIIKQLKREMDNGEDFKVAFHAVCKKYILTGDCIEADLPRILTRVILDDSKFIDKIGEGHSFPITRDYVKEAVDSNDSLVIEELLGTFKLSLRDVVFTTFDERDMEMDPFTDRTLKDILNILALDVSPYSKDKPLTAIYIRYMSKDEVKKRYPVFPDAGWLNKFYPPDENDKYGRTKPLDKSHKGMPEIVHENLRLAEVIKYIGFIEE